MTKRRDTWSARANQMKKHQRGRNDGANKEAINDHEDQCRVLFKPRGQGSGSICMDLDEVKTCRELRIELPCDWTVEIPCGLSEIDTSTGVYSPIVNSRISSPGI